MTDLASALADTSDLGEFEGKNVLATGIEIRNAAGGLHDALAIDPEVIKGGDKRYVVLEVDCRGINHVPITDGKEGPMIGWKRVHVLKAGSATFVDEDLVKKHVDEQRDRIQRARDLANGQGRVDVEAEHLDGKHAEGLVEGCAHCEAERLAEQEEQSSEPESGDPE